MRVTVIGGTGHIGTYLVPKLSDAGHEVTIVSRGNRKPYHDDPAWRRVHQVTLDRTALDSEELFGERIRSLKPDAVIDLICFEPTSADGLMKALQGHIAHFLHCGTIWIYGHSGVHPTTESHPRRATTDYGRKKAQIERMLLAEAAAGDFPATLIHPGHISGPGWEIINPAGNCDVSVFARLARGERVVLPNFGMETLHHVHADDVAGMFVAALERRTAAVGESFNCVSPAALTMRGYAEAVASWFDVPPQLDYQPWEQWRTTVSAEAAALTETHMLHNPCCSVQKAQAVLGFRPNYSSLEAAREAVEWYIEQGLISLADK